MRSACIFFFVILIAIQVSDNFAGEVCPQDNCMTSDRCDTPWYGADCPNKQHSCCSVVKKEYRTVCRHHGGACVKKCPQNLQRTATNCSADKVCCVLV